MGVESATFVSNLNPSLPGSSDSQAQGDDHLRLIKSALQNTFPNASKQLYFPTTIAYQTTTYSVSAPGDCGKVIPVKGGQQVNLPATGMFDGFEVIIVKADHNSSVVSITPSGYLINGVAFEKLFQRFQSARVVWCAAFGGWLAQIDPVVPIGAAIALFNGVVPAPAGYVLANGLTIGGASSLADYKGAEYQGLFEVLYVSIADAICTVSGGRSGVAATDFTASKTLKLPDLRGVVLGGLDNMGGLPAIGKLPWGITLAEAGGEPSHVLTVAELAQHAHGVTDPGHVHTEQRMVLSNVFAISSSTPAWKEGSPATQNTGSATTGITINSAGGNVAHNNIQPTVTTNWALKI